MNEIKILHCADLHIGATERFLGTAAKKRRIETLMTFERIIETAQKNEVDFLLIAGDLLDSNTVESDLIDRVFAGFEKIPETEIIFAAGNHDPLDAASPFVTRPLPEHLHVLGTADTVLDFPEKQVKVFGRSFKEVYLQGKDRFSLPVTPDGETVYLMVQHGDLSVAASDYNGISPDFIRTSGMDYIALGHIHKRTEVQTLDGTAFAYCGCPEGQGFDETGEKGVLFGTVGKGTCDLTFLPLAKRRHERISVDLSACESATGISEHILTHLENLYGKDYAENLYHITLTGAVEESFRFSVAEISARLNDAVYFAKVKNHTTVCADLELLANEPSLKGIFVRKMSAALTAASEEEKPKLEAALQIGLQAFRGEIDDFDAE